MLMSIFVFVTTKSLFLFFSLVRVLHGVTMTDAVLAFTFQLYKYPQYLNRNLLSSIDKIVSNYLREKSRLRKQCHPIIYRRELYELQSKTIDSIVVLLPKKLREILQL